MAPELDVPLPPTTTTTTTRFAAAAAAEMEAYEATRIVYSRVQVFDPENVSKIMGYLLLQDQGEEEILRLAVGPDSLLQSAIAKATMQLGLIKCGALQLSDRHQMMPQGDAGSNFARERQQYSSSIPQHEQLQMLQGKLAALQSAEKAPLLYSRQQQQQQPQPHQHVESSSFSGGVFPNDHFYPETFAFLNSSKIKAEKSGGGWQLLDELTDLGSAWKPCVYYSRGFCNHGSSCRFLHAHMLNNSSSGPSSPDNQFDGSSSEEALELGSLERLELELQELLSGRKAPVSIAALPQLYYERFGRPLQAEGYLTESQRHGKSGYNLTRLLSRLKDTITVIDRPHGQHAVVLTEDAHKFATYQGEHYDLSGVNPSSRQIYLTFPAESAFTEDDVNIHFRAYGPVQDVRIPYQQKRMFGFVTFVYPETVKIVLSEGNPHYICGARVLVKPYRERGKHGDRKQVERTDSSKYMEFPTSGSGKEISLPVLKFLDESRFPPLPQLDESILLERRLEKLQLQSEMSNFPVEGQTKWGLNFSNILPPNEHTATLEDSHHYGNHTFGLLLDALDREMSNTAKPNSCSSERMLFNVTDQHLASSSSGPKSAPEKIHEPPACKQELNGNSKVSIP